MRERRERHCSRRKDANGGKGIRAACTIIPAGEGDSREKETTGKGSRDHEEKRKKKEGG